MHYDKIIYYLNFLSFQQVNLEYLARVVFDQNQLLFPDSLVGTDSHTTMINGLGVVGWGVGGQYLVIFCVFLSMCSIVMINAILRTFKKFRNRSYYYSVCTCWRGEITSQYLYSLYLSFPIWHSRMKAWTRLLYRQYE